MQTTISPKEADFLSDLMTYESILCKKCKFYGKTMFDEEVASLFNQLSDGAQKRFSGLLEQL